MRGFLVRALPQILSAASTVGMNRSRAQERSHCGRTWNRTSVPGKMTSLSVISHTDTVLQGDQFSLFGRISKRVWPHGTSRRDLMLSQEDTRPWDLRGENEPGFNVESFKRLPRGIPNIGNTCYIGAVLQVLSASTLFINILEDLPPSPREQDLLKKSLSEIVHSINEGGELDEKLSTLHNAIIHSTIHPDFRNAMSRQQDAAAFLELCLNTAGYKLQGTQFLRYTYEGGLWIIDPRDESYTLLSLPVEKGVGLQEQFERYFQDEVLIKQERTLETLKNEQHRWEEVISSKRCLKAPLPSLLCIQLKRFLLDEKKPVKNEVPVEIPFELSTDSALCSPRENSSVHFALIGFILHVGPLLESGHYVCYIKRGDFWFFMNDKEWRISSLDEVNEAKNHSYIAFWEDPVVNNKIDCFTIPKT